MRQQSDNIPRKLKTQKSTHVPLADQEIVTKGQLTVKEGTRSCHNSAVLIHYQPNFSHERGMGTPWFPLNTPLR